MKMDSMPAPLPAASAYTYAVELSVDEARNLDAAEVKFDKPVAIYVDNFLDFPTGTPVPAGYYDRRAETWKSSDDGRVIRILDIVGGLAVLGVDDETKSDEERLAELGIDNAERKKLASQYEIGKSLWRVQVEHFTPYDFNWGFSRPSANGPKGRNKNKPREKDPCKQSGSIIECDNQVLGEILPITGTPYVLSYRSDRATGGKNIEISLTDDDDDVSEIAWIELTITVAGQRFYKRFSTITQNMNHLFEWDGLDAYGRRASGPRTASVRIKYAQKVNYVSPNTTNGQSFGMPGGEGQMMGTGDRAISVLTSTFNFDMGQFDAQSTHAMGGWMLANRHVYDRFRQELYPGAEAMRASKDSTYIVSGAYDFEREIKGLPFPIVGANPLNFVSAPDGSLYLAISVKEQFGVQVIRFDPGSDVWEHIAGKVVRDEQEFLKCSVDGKCGQNGDATQAILLRKDSDFGFGLPSARSALLAISPIDQSVYYSGGTSCINRIKNKKMAIIVGDCKKPLFPAFSEPDDPNYKPVAGASLAVDPDGNLYLAELDRIIKFDPDGKNSRLYAGGEKSGDFFDGASFLNTRLTFISALEFNAQGTIYIHDITNGLFRVEGDGRIRSIETAEFSASRDVVDLTASDTGEIYIATNIGVYQWDEDSLTLVAGGTDASDVTGGANKDRRIKGDNIPAPLFLARMFDMAVTSDGVIYLVAVTPGTTEASLRTLAHLFDNLPGYDEGKNLVPEKNGSLLYVFGDNGQHLKTLDAIEGKVQTSFEYDDQQRLEKIIDRDGLATTLNYTSAGILENIIGPYGHKTEIVINEGYLREVIDPDGATWKMDYDNELKLLSKFTNPRGNSSTFQYSPTGKLTKDTDAVNGFKALKREGNAVVLTTAMGRTTRYSGRSTDRFGSTRVVTNPAGLETETRIRYFSEKKITQPNGTVRLERMDPDPRFGMITPYLGETLLTLPSGKKLKIEQIREVVLQDPLNPLSVKSMTSLTKVGDMETRTEYDLASKTIFMTSAEGRKSYSKLDENGRIIETKKDGLLPTFFEYDNDGRLLEIKQGTRKSAFRYDEKSNLNKVSDALQRVVNFDFDAVGRISKQTLPDGRTHSFSYDANGNVASVKPFGSQEHGFVYNDVDQATDYNPPALQSVANPSSTRTYNLDHQIVKTISPEGLETQTSYDEGGRPISLATPRGTYEIQYASTGQIDTIKGPNGGKKSFEYDGDYLKKITHIQEEVSGTLSLDYDEFFRLKSADLDGKKADYTYDKDSALLTAGDLSYLRDSLTGFISETNLLKVKSRRVLNEYGIRT